MRAPQPLTVHHASDTWVFTTPAEGERDSDKGEKAKAKGRDPEAAAYIRANHRSTQWTQLSAY